LSSFDIKRPKPGPSPFDREAGADGPFAPPVNKLLGRSFGRSLSGLRASRDGASNQALGAKAHTVGTSISLGDGVREDPSDGASMQVLAHEVAHALGGGGSGQKAIDGGRDDAGEDEAHAASDAFRGYIDEGAEGPPPALEPATGGEAVVHRFDSGEHAHAVDNAARTMAEAGKPVDPAVAAQMARPVTLANGVTVTQGQITAMMGDYYAAYTTDPQSGKEHFDPARSFDYMNNADPKEMTKLAAIVGKEEGKVESALQQNASGTAPDVPNAMDIGPVNAVTDHRRTEVKKNDDGSQTTTGLAYLELAQRNSAHFNSGDESGTNNNMGAYDAFKKMSLEAAAQAAAMPPGPEREKAEQKALALEASGEHFLTDRFSAGHQFDKDKIVSENGGGLIGNLKARTFHEEPQEGGLDVKNAAGETWRAMDDGHWADRENADNRQRAAQATTDSYGELNSVLSGQRTPADIEAGPLAARKSTPVWDQAREDSLEKRAQGMSTLDVLTDKQVLPSVPSAIGDAAGREFDKAENGVVDAGKKVEGGASSLWGDIKDGASHAWSSASHAIGSLFGRKKGGADDLGALPKPTPAQADPHHDRA
jgi:hypothetical protein